MTVDNLVISSGSCRGISIVAALNKHSQFLKNVKNFSGVSVGSMICLVLVLNLPLVKIIEELSTLFFPFKFGFHTCSKVLGFHTFEDSHLRRKLIGFFALANISPAVTFKELFELTGKFLNVRITQLQKDNQRDGKTVDHIVRDCNVDSTPNRIVLETVMASCGMPYIFMPRKDQEGFCVIDGAVTEAARMPMLPSFDPKHTLGVLILSNNRKNTDYPCKYMIFLDCPRVKFTTLNVTPAMVNYLLKVGRDSIISK